MTIIPLIRKIVFIALCAAIAQGFVSNAFAGDIIVISNKNVDAVELSKQDVKNIFLGKKTKWDNNEKITFVTLKGKVDHKDFLKKYVGKTESQYRSFWKKMVFTGRGKEPKSFKTVEGMIDYIAKTKGAVGYISTDVDSDKVKKIAK